MVATVLCKYLHFITLIYVVSGFKNDPNPSFKRSKDLQDTMTDLTHYPGLQYYTTRNAKRMTMDDNARTRGAWGQMNPQYYQPQPQQQYQNQYYPSMQGNSYFTSTEYAPPATSTGGAIINIYKQMEGKNGGPPSSQRQPPLGIPPKNHGNNPMNPSQPKMQDPRGQDPQDPGKKKVKVLICKLHQGQN